MKVKIGKYTSWFGPYQLASALCFWAKPVKDEHDMMGEPDWVHKFGEMLAYGSAAPESDDLVWEDKRRKTWLYRFLDWIQSKKKRKVIVKLEPYDTWSMDNTLALIILPMLKQILDQKHGSPFVDHEDVPLEMRPTKEQYDGHMETGDTDLDPLFHDRWTHVISEMIFAFETEAGSTQNWEEGFVTGHNDARFEKIDEEGTLELVYGPDHTEVIDQESRDQYQQRIQNGFRLFGKYYSNLWS